MKLIPRYFLRFRRHSNHVVSDLIHFNGNDITMKNNTGFSRSSLILLFFFCSFSLLHAIQNLDDSGVNMRETARNITAEANLSGGFGREGSGSSGGGGGSRGGGSSGGGSGSNGGSSGSSGNGYRSPSNGGSSGSPGNGYRSPYGGRAYPYVGAAGLMASDHGRKHNPVSSTTLTTVALGTTILACM